MLTVELRFILIQNPHQEKPVFPGLWCWAQQKNLINLNNTKFMLIVKLEYSNLSLRRHSNYSYYGPRSITSWAALAPDSLAAKLIVVEPVVLTPKLYVPSPLM